MTSSPPPGKCGRQHPPTPIPAAGGWGSETPGEGLRMRIRLRLDNLAHSGCGPPPGLALDSFTTRARESGRREIAMTSLPVVVPHLFRRHKV